MKGFPVIVSATVLLLVLCGGFAVSTTPPREPAVQEEFEPIDNMHHFMEYISQPGYLGLKEALASEPADRKAWKVVKSHALVLAETSALVADRVPDDVDEQLASQWKETSLAVFESGRDLYRSAGDYQQARANYETMIDNCNRCHQIFDEGRHQLEK